MSYRTNFGLESKIKLTIKLYKMNISKILNIVLALALLVLILKFSIKSSDKTTDSKTDSKSKVEVKNTREVVLDVINSRKSVRFYTDEKVSDEDINTILRAGMAAPTALDKRPWKFVVIKNKETMKLMRKDLVYAKGLDESPVAIVVCGDMTKVHKGNPEFWITDTSAATENMLLAMEAMGLGGVWSAIYPSEQRMSYIRKVLDLPETIMPLCVIPFGHPKGVEKAKDKYDANNIHWEKW